MGGLDVASRMPLFRRLCSDYSSQMLEGLITSKQIKACVIKGFHDYSSVRCLIDEHLRSAAMNMKVKREQYPLRIDDEDDSWDETDWQEVENARRAVDKNMNRSKGNFGWLSIETETEEESNLSELDDYGTLVQTDEDSGCDIGMIGSGGHQETRLVLNKVLYDSSDEEAPCGLRKVILENDSEEEGAQKTK